MDIAVRRTSANVRSVINHSIITPIFASRSVSQIAPMDIAFVLMSASAMKVIDYWKPAQTFANLFANNLA